MGLFSTYISRTNFISNEGPVNCNKLGSPLKETITGLVLLSLI
jgi:hypothetical protein